MLTLGSLAFLNPWVLAGLAALPIIWWLLRAIPPSPKTQVFAGVRLLLGLEDEERQTDRTPWWLLLLRSLAIAAALVGFSQPVMNLSARIGGGSGPLLLLMDAGWASAPDWAERGTAVREILDEADQAGREVLFWPTDEDQGGAPPLVSAKAAESELTSAEPRPWAPDYARLLDQLRASGVAVGETVWLHDGLAHQGTAELLDYLSGKGRLRLIGPAKVAHGLTPPRLKEGVLTADVLRAAGGAGVGAGTGSGAAGDESVEVVAMAAAEGGGERRIAVGRAELAGGAVRAPVSFDLPTELQNEVTRIALAVRPSAGGAAFADGAIRRVKAGLVAPATDDAVRGLISPVFYLEKALVPWADLVRGDIETVLAADPAVVILADQGEMTDAERKALADWVGKGGLLVRFAGPRLAAAIGAEGFGGSALVGGDDPLLPVRLRRGGRVLGGALAWTTPRALGPFDPAGPFRGLKAPDEVEVRTQVLAEPSPDLAGRVWATLEDGTPLVTGKKLGDGHVVLFHVSSDAEWSSLPLSGLFVEMLGRLMSLAPGRSAGTPDPSALEGTLWRAETLMGADGAPRPVSSLVEPVPGERLAVGGAGPDLPPGVYARAARSSDASGAADSLVVNVLTAESELAPFPSAPAGAIVETLGGVAPVRYGPWLIGLALLIACIDVLGTLVASGRMAVRRRGAAAAGALLVLLVVAPDCRAQAASASGDLSPEAVSVAAETTLGYVRTGDRRTDEISERGMVGLGNELTRKTAVEPGPPVGVVPGVDELSLYPVLYWPLAGSAVPGQDALEALAGYIRNGGLLIIDTQNGASGMGGATAVEMREIARALNLPPLAPVDQDHVLTRTFYLLTDFPGRWRGGRVWAEAPPLRAPGSEPPPEDIPQFDRVDDNVSPVLVGSADWAAAWAVDDQGMPMFPIGRPGDRQREMAYRFGINAVMYALTGNYKSDQVHAPAVLQRLGQ